MGPVEAFSANSDTFYDLRTGHRHGLRLRYFSIITGGIVLRAVGLEFQANALTALIPVLGVLLGFGYSVQFYIAGTAVPKIRSDEYLEDSGDKRILERLASEVYDNVVYLNFVILFSLMPSFSLLIPVPPFVNASSSELSWFMNMLGGVLIWIFILEVMSTFYRVLVRSSFFFSERRRLETASID